MSAYSTLPFLPYGSPVAIAATTASTANALPRAKDQTVVISNPVGNGTVFALLGISSTIAASSANCVPVTAGRQGIIQALQAQTHIAIALSSGTGNVWVNCGDGVSI
jgi:hypothetical protein